MSKNKSLRERREENERKRLSKQSQNTHLPKSVPYPKNTNSFGNNPNTNGKGKSSPSKRQQKGFGNKTKNIFHLILDKIRSSRYLQVLLVVTITLTYSWNVYNFSTLIHENQNLIWFAIILAVLLTLYLLLLNSIRGENARRGYFINFIMLTYIVIFTTGAFTSITVDGKVYLATSEVAQVHKISTEMWDDLNIIASAENLLLSSGAESRAYYPTMEEKSEELGKISVKWTKISQKNSLPAPGLIEAAAQLAASADWGSRALIRKAQSIVEPDPKADADVTEWLKLYQESGSAAGETVSRVSAIYGIKLEGYNE